MSDLTGLFDALYSKLLLRDFFGKVVPGTILILSVSIVLFSPDKVGEFIKNVSFYSAILLIGFAWIVAFSIQALGEVTHLIRYHTYNSNREYYTRRYKFRNQTNPEEHQQLERLVVIKEACGNGYVALGLSAILISVNFLIIEGCEKAINYVKLYWPTIVFFVLIIIFLAVMHFIHVMRQDEYMNTILDAKKSNGESV